MPDSVKLLLALNSESWESIQLIPAPDAQGVVRGRDGRAWTLNNMSDVVAWLERNGDIAIDVNHALEVAAPQGLPSEAMGWIGARDLEIRDDGSLWARPRWTSGGSDVMKRQAYRYVSPTLLHDPNQADSALGTMGRVVGLSSIGLTNRPNLPVAALNSKEEKTEMKELAKSLGLPEDATAEQIQAAVNALKAPKVEAPKVEDKPVDIQAAVNAALAAALPAALAKVLPSNQAPSLLETAANAVLDKAIADGKIMPSQRDLFKAQCASEEGLQAFQVSLNGMEKLLKTETNGPKGKPASKPPTPTDPDTQKLCRAFNCRVEDLDKDGPGKLTGRIEHEYIDAWANPVRIEESK